MSTLPVNLLSCENLELGRMVSVLVGFVIAFRLISQFEENDEEAQYFGVF